MRRVASIILFVLGGWMLTSEAMVAWMDMGLGWSAQLVGLAVMLPFFLVPLGLGAWASPGNRFAELGLTLMIAAGVAAFCALAVFLAFNDPQVIKMMPPGQKIPNFAINPLLGGLNLLLIAGCGYLLWRRGRSRARAKAELERVFGD
jgi:uncharacterized membrane protein